MFKFRKLNPGECRILLVRHVDHNSNFLPDLSVLYANATGRALKAAGLKINGAVSSMAPRALRTNIEIQYGYGSACNVPTDDRLAAMDIENPAVVTLLKARMEARGLSGDAGYAEVGFDENEKSLFAIMSRRGKEGAACLQEIAATNDQKNILVTSHGVFRIEATIMFLKYHSLSKLERLAETGQVIELIITISGKLIEDNWLPVVPL